MTDTKFPNIRIQHDDNGDHHLVTLKDIAFEALSYDGFEWEIRPTEDGHSTFTLWRSKYSRNSGHGSGQMENHWKFDSDSHDEDEAQDEICMKVGNAVANGERFKGMSDNIYWQTIEDFFKSEFEKIDGAEGQEAAELTVAFVAKLREVFD